VAEDQKLPKRSEDFSEWYNQLVLRAELADYAPVVESEKRAEKPSP
jgi:prolyl-tRNA synthetase